MTEADQERHAEDEGKSPSSERSYRPPILQRTRKFEFLFFWLRWFYPQAKGMHFLFLLMCFPFQKLLRINGRVPWPVHFTSRVLYHKNITVGHASAPGFNSCCYIQGRNGIEVGHNLRMGPGVGLISANHDLDNYEAWVNTRPIRIGDNVWIGMHAVVMPGVHIGDNVVVAAGSVVTRDVPSNCVVGGNPSKVLKDKGPYRGIDFGKL